MTVDDGSAEPEPVAAEEESAPDATAAEAPETTEDAAQDAQAEEAPADPASSEYEGPRRRARREREERREALDRARAIEQARQDARRRAAGLTDQPKMPGRGVIRGLKLLLWSAVAAVLAVTMGLVLYFTPIMAVRNTVVNGLTTITEDEVQQAAAVRPDTPLLQVNTDAVAERIATIRRVASARVQREYPSTLRITVVERVPVAAKDYPDGRPRLDRDGVDFAAAPPPPGLPYLDADNPGPKDPATKAALEVLLSLRPEVYAQVA
ncbi:FtsQ-type POTRA domain-containing protein, partial [Mycobacterium sp. CBMA361]|nr:FtsQ-type POTRA domain-containing protein [Mycolicibacterium sp. CBMA 361]